MEKIKLISNRFSDADVYMEIVAVDKASNVIKKVSAVLEEAATSQQILNNTEENAAKSQAYLNRTYKSTVKNISNVIKELKNQQILI